MLGTGDIIRIPDWKFNDGETRDKYMVILWDSDLEAIGFLTTSKERYVSSENLEGCNFKKVDDYSFIHYYKILSDIEIGTNKFCFEKNTLIRYKTGCQKFSKIVFDKNYGDKIEECCRLKSNMLLEILECVVKSQELPQKDLKKLKTKLAALKAA